MIAYFDGINKSIVGASSRETRTFHMLVFKLRDQSISNVHLQKLCYLQSSRLLAILQHALLIFTLLLLLEIYSWFDYRWLFEIHSTHGRDTTASLLKLSRHPEFLLLFLMFFTLEANFRSQIFVYFLIESAFGFFDGTLS